MVDESDSAERGQAIVVAMIIMFLSAIIVVGVTVAVRSGSERGSDSRERDTAYGTAKEGEKTYKAALSSGQAGESTDFALTAAVLKATVGGVQCTAAESRPCWDWDKNTAFPKVDNTTIPIKGGNQITIRKEISAAAGGSGTYAYWQMLSVVPPRYGVGCPPPGAGPCVAPGGRAVAYIRAWIGPIGATTNNKPLVTRTEFRAAQFSDYELVADGKINAGVGANIDGAVHSNGFPTSYQDQYKTQAQQVKFASPGVNCKPWARVTVSTTPAPGWYSGPPGVCSGLRTTTGVATVNLLRANNMIATARTRCGAPPPLRVLCYSRAVNDPIRYDVRLQANGFVSVTGVGNFDARNTAIGWAPGGQYGLVLVFNRSANVSGTLGSNGRLTIMTGASNTGRISEPPSVYFNSKGSVGSDSSPRTAVGFISANDIVGIEKTACPLTIRAAMVAAGGMLSMDPRYRGQLASGDKICKQKFTVLGSISGHNPPLLFDGWSGFANRTYSYDGKLFDNPPPMFPIVRNWDVQSTTLANIDCFSTATLLADRTGCS